MKSFLAKKGQCEHKWVLVDADGAILGRMASKIAPILMGKNKPTYTPVSYTHLTLPTSDLV